jgi:hypothetical protein
LASLAGAAGGVVFAADAARCEAAEQHIPGAIKMTFGKEVMIGAQSTAVKMDNRDIHIISIGKGTFQLDKESRLTATLNGAMAQYAKTEYWISVAVFDAAGYLLGTAAYKEAVQYIRLGLMFTTVRRIQLDFGISKAFKDAAQIVVAVSNREVPPPGEHIGTLFFG